MSTPSRHQPGHFCWVDLSSRDMKTITEFYGSMFGWSSEMQDTQGGPPYAEWRLEGKTLGGLGQLDEAMQSQGIPPTWNSYISVTDVEATVAKATELGATITVPPMQVMDVGKLAYMMDPTGGHVALWQPLSHGGVEVADRPGAVFWNELATRDMEGASKFYGELFGWSFENSPHSPTNYLLASTGDGPLAGLMQMDENWGDMPPHWMVYFAVSDADAACKSASEAGGKVCVPAFDTPVGRLAVINDPQGAVFSIIQPAAHAKD